MSEYTPYISIETCNICILLYPQAHKCVRRYVLLFVYSEDLGCHVLLWPCVPGHCMSYTLVGHGGACSRWPALYHSCVFSSPWGPWICERVVADSRADGPVDQCVWICVQVSVCTYVWKFCIVSSCVLLRSSLPAWMLNNQQSLCLSVTLPICSSFAITMAPKRARVFSCFISRTHAPSLLVSQARSLVASQQCTHIHNDTFLLSHRISSSSRVISSWLRSSSSSRKLSARETHLYDSYTCDSCITCISLKFWKNCPSNTLFSGKYTWNMSSKKTGNTLSCSLPMYLPQKNSADAKCAPQTAARGTALRCAVKVRTSHQILPGPLVLTVCSVWYIPRSRLVIACRKSTDTTLHDRRTCASNMPETL